MNQIFSAITKAGASVLAEGRRHPLLATILATWLVSLVFWTMPGLDQATTGLFHSPETWFPARTDEALVAFRNFGIRLTRGLMIVLVLLVLVRVVFWDYPSVLSGRALAFLLSTAVLGPGLLINIILKDFWGRPRPHMVEDYGGEAPYIPVWQASGLCDGNCSFVSGEASATFWMMSFVFLAPRDLRMPVFLVVAVLTVTLSLNRVAFGGHFLSDVILSWCLTLFVLLAMKALILDPCRRRGDDPYDAFLVRLGQRLTAALDRSRLAR